ncbi:MAG: Hsp20/alpha crystallin family protein [Candidatus Pacebacteria bacterium]|nr:Hsp20/alpha crystallin family protein [Candidatus Paceibacterota bacterium]
MKKRSFFERLAGNLRFDDNEEEEVQISKKDMSVQGGESKNGILEVEHLDKKIVSEEQKEEVGELPVDVYETQNEIIIQTLIAGVLPDNLSISITRDMVTIKGKREENKSISSDQYVIKELYWGSFARTVQLPEEVEIDTSEAIERHGMLMIKLPKTDRGRKTVLKIKSI